MHKTHVINLAKQIYDRYHTSDPFKLASEIDCKIIYKEMPEKLRGFTLKNFRINIVYLNENLSEVDKRNTLLHELGHIFCGHDENRIFTSLMTNQVVSKLENEADLFLVSILLNAIDNDEIKNYSVKQLSCRLGVQEDKIRLYFF